jgi:hypothetical protein
MLVLEFSTKSRNGNIMITNLESFLVDGLEAICITVRFTLIEMPRLRGYSADRSDADCICVLQYLGYDSITSSENLVVTEA